MARVLLFDVLRILGIVLILVYHMAGYINRQEIISGFGNLGVMIMVFVSGCVLEYTYGKKKYTYIEFIRKRILRVYPVVIIAMILSVVVYVMNGNTFNIIEFVGQTTGFYPYLHHFFPTIFTVTSDGIINNGGDINSAVWFVGMIMVLYLLYPLITKLVDRFGLIFLIFVFILPLYFVSFQPYTSPQIRLPFFVFGIYLVKNGLFVNKSHTSKVINVFSDCSFQIFMLNNALLFLLITPLSQQIDPFYHQIIEVLIYGSVLCAVSYLLYVTDRYIQHRFNNNLYIDTK
jgi:peptidoglycan/LPS O-acetylase OafA/YrhL